RAWRARRRHTPPARPPNVGRPRRGHSRRARPPSDLNAEHGYRLALSLELHWRADAERWRRLERAAHLIREKDLPRFRRGAEAIRRVHHVADHGELEPPLRADVPRERLAVVQTDTDRELRALRRLPAAIEPLHRMHHVDGGAHRAVRVVARA